jgi:hypothetical protein
VSPQHRDRATSGEENLFAADLRRRAQIQHLVRLESGKTGSDGSADAETGAAEWNLSKAMTALERPKSSGLERGRICKDSGARPTCAPSPERQVQTDGGHRQRLKAVLSVATGTKPAPPNALIDHWPFACNRLDCLGFRVQQRMLLYRAGQTCH